MGVRKIKTLNYILRRCFGQVAKIKEKKWDAVIGLEIHAKITSESKLFSGAATNFQAAPNTQVSWFDAALPGTLPVLNRRCAEQAIKTAVALGAKLNKTSWFDRKHYFYADLPAGYQITQQRAPLAVDGEFEFAIFTPGIHKQPYIKRARLKQIQLEQDSGKSIHDEEGARSLIDLNRAGCPLMELVFEPNLQDGEEAGALVKDLRILLKRLGVCDCKMEEGSLRVDANISVKPVGCSELGVRTEVKNLNSIRSLVSACKSEIARHIKILESGGDIVNETRGFSNVTGGTVSMRDKEVKQDYRFMPEPNLLPLRLSDTCDGTPVDDDVIDIYPLSQNLPPSPSDSRNRVMEQYNLSLTSAFILVQEEGLLNYFEEAVTPDIVPKKLYNLIMNDLKLVLNDNNIPILKCPIKPCTLTEVCRLMQDRIVSTSTLPHLIKELLNNPDSQPLQILKDRDWIHITDRAEIEALCDNVLNDSVEKVEQYKKASEKKRIKLWNYFLNTIKKQSDNKADMKLVTEIMKKKLEKL